MIAVLMLFEQPDGRPERVGRCGDLRVSGVDCVDSLVEPDDLLVLLRESPNNPNPGQGIVQHRADPRPHVPVPVTLLLQPVEELDRQQSD